MGWTFSISDPGAVAWLTVLLYFVAAAACLPVSVQSRGETRWFWLLLAAVMTGLGLNKQLDLQSLLTQMARDNALQYGWYESRRAVQAAFLAGLAAAGGALVTTLAATLSGHGRAVGVAVYGIALLTIFVIARAASFYHIDAFLMGWKLGGVKINAVIEIGGIALVVLGAALAAARRD